MEFPNYWKDIIRDALAESIAQRESSIPGAKLRPLIAENAASRGYEFPPPGLISFKAFVCSFPDVVKILSRPGQDFLAVPPDREDLLRAGAGCPVIRKDRFDAFTRFDSFNRAGYNPEADQATWLPEGTDAPGWIAIPRATEAGEVAFRRAFAEDIEDPTQKEALLSSLKYPRPLSEFTKVIANYKLGQLWHRYRFKRMLERIKTWADENSIPFKDSWVSVVPMAQYDHPVDIMQRGQESNFLSALGKLTNDDLSRILVPLDLVLKTLRNM